MTDSVDNGNFVLSKHRTIALGANHPDVHKTFIRGSRRTGISRLGFNAGSELKDRGITSHHLNSAVSIGFGNRLQPDRNWILRPSKGINLQAPHTGSQVIYKIRGRIGGVYRTWISTVSPLDPHPDGEIITDVSYFITESDPT